MRYTNLGNSDLSVSRVCLGCMGFGDAGSGQHSWTVDEAHSREIIRRALELGVNFFDTAISYQSGTSEQYVVRAGKVRHIGVSNCFVWQLAKANALADKEGFARFVSVQGHYNLIFREEEREMAQLCGQDHIAMTPYSALAGGLLSKVSAPVVGATRLHHVEGAANAVDLTLAAEELAYLEEPYVPHALVGVMAQNTAAAAKKPHVWSTGNQNIK